MKVKSEFERFYSSILDVVRQNKYNILKILVKLQVGLKQKDLNMALLHAVKAGMTRMHSSRMRTGRSLTVCWSLLPGGVCSGGGGSA